MTRAHSAVWLAASIARDLAAGEQPRLSILSRDIGSDFLLVAETIRLLGGEYELTVLSARKGELVVQFSTPIPATIVDRRAA